MARRETTNGDLRVPVSFYSAEIEEGLDGRDIASEETFKTFAEVYNPSLKDIEIASGMGVRASLTIKIRDPLKDYQPQREHLVEIKDNRLNGQKWKIIDRRPDFRDRKYLILILGGVSGV